MLSIHVRQRLSCYVLFTELSQGQTQCLAHSALSLCIVVEFPPPVPFFWGGGGEGGNLSFSSFRVS